MNELCVHCKHHVVRLNGEGLDEGLDTEVREKVEDVLDLADDYVVHWQLACNDVLKISTR